MYLSGVYGQISATAGNLWSYSPPSDPSKYYRSRYNERVAYDSADIRREIPFIDKAYKNDNYMLYDLAAEIRVTSEAIRNRVRVCPLHFAPWGTSGT